MYKKTLKIGMMLLIATMLLALPVQAAENNAEEQNSQEQTAEENDSENTETTSETEQEETENEEEQDESAETEAVTTTQASLSAYELEVLAVMEKGLVTQTPTEEANKCEVLQIMARAFKWTIDENATTEFTDLPEWCQPVAGTAFANGIVEGRTSTQLGLDSPVSRFEVAVMLHRELLRRNYEFTGTTKRTFTDELVEWASDAVNALVSESIIKGFEDGRFGGTLGILKQDLGVMLLRLEMPSEKEDETPAFIDDNLTGSWTFLEATLNSETTLSAEDSEKEFKATFDNTGRVSISGDCNSIIGSFTATSEGLLSFGPLAMTKMYCEESIETEFTTHLNATTEYSIEEDTLTLLIAKEQQTGTMTFQKSE